MSRILVATFGSYGDLFPYLALGAELRFRGHEVTIGTSESFRPKVEGANLRFHAVRPNMSLDDAELLAYVFDARRGSERVVRMVASVVRESYEDTLVAAQAADIIITHPIAFGAVLVARKLQIPWASSVLAPTSFFSSYDPPVLAPAPWLTRWWPFGRSMLHALFTHARHSALPWVEPVLRLSDEIGLKPFGNPLFEGSHSPELVLALYSRLLGIAQPDWPRNTVQTGFPFYDEAAGRTIDLRLREFFDAGDPPVVFTLGSSAVGAAGAFYSESLKAVERLGVRALFLTGSHKHGLPDKMPNGTLAWPYASHAIVFARARAIVHQGGIGTTAQAMRAGRPMLIVPFAHDQFDNAERVKQLGAAEVVYRSRYSAGKAEQALGRLLATPAYSEAAARVCRELQKENGTYTAASAIEPLASGKSATVSS